MGDFREMILNKDMAFFIDAKWSEKELNRIGYLNKGDARDFLEEVFRYAAQDDSLVLTSSLSTQIFNAADYNKDGKVTKEELFRCMAE